MNELEAGLVKWMEDGLRISGMWNPSEQNVIALALKARELLIEREMGGEEYVDTYPIRFERPDWNDYYARYEVREPDTKWQVRNNANVEIQDKRNRTEGVAE